MIEAHTLDAWTRATARHGVVFRDLTVLGGFAAPLFLWLAGLAVVLSATRTTERTGSRAAAFDAICRRGLEIFILAFLFRLQAFVVSPGSHPVALFRVDILNVMGPAIAAAGIIWACAPTRTTRAIAFGAAAFAVAMITPIVRASAAIETLPIWFQWYLRPVGDATTFTLLPWAGFVFAGGAVGSLIADARDASSERRLQAVFAVVGIALVAGGFYASGRPSIYKASSFWTSSPTWFAIRVGIMMVALAGLNACTTNGAPARRVAQPSRDALANVGASLERFGRSSLFVYWVHVELVYGYASWLWRHRLPLWGTGVAYAAFCVLMYGAIVLRDRVVADWRARRTVPTVQTATV
jgi:uncharacterized membrane protein